MKKHHQLEYDNIYVPSMNRQSFFFVDRLKQAIDKFKTAATEFDMKVKNVNTSRLMSFFMVLALLCKLSIKHHQNKLRIY